MQTFKKTAAFCPVSDKVGGLNSPTITTTSIPCSTPNINAIFKASVITVRFLRPFNFLAISGVIDPTSRIMVSPGLINTKHCWVISVFFPCRPVVPMKQYEPDSQHLLNRRPHAPVSAPLFLKLFQILADSYFSYLKELCQFNDFSSPVLSN
jgi:hypothetical protein